MDSFSQGLFEFLFKYRPVVFERGDFALSAPWPIWVLLAAVLGIAAPTILSYARVRGRVGARDRGLLIGIRFALLGVLLFCLSRPILVLATVVPQENFLGVLFDDSRSMQIADDGEVSRSSFLYENFGPEGSDLLAGLTDRFKLRFFGFSETAERVANLDELNFAGNRTRLGQALEQASRELSAVPLAGLVVFTDGADNSDAQLSETILQLRGQGVPVHAVGLGNVQFERDIEITRVEAPRFVLAGSSIAADVMVVHSGFGGELVQLNVEDDGRILSSQAVELPLEGVTVTTRVHFTAADAGPKVFTFRILSQSDEQVAENNERDVLVDVRTRPNRILYIEGEPRFEVGNLRRAVADDETIEVVVLTITAENKYYRQGVRDENEVLTGFPTTREELFQYSGIILGSVDASYFTHDQLEMITEFVGDRGGGLLALGGRHSFAAGGYLGTPIDNVLPVILETRVDGDTAPAVHMVKVELTPAGRSHPTTQIARSPDDSENRWPELPELSTVNPITNIKPGASTLLVGAAEGLDRLVVLASQRYGRGLSVAFTVQDSWLWQMHADMAADDLTHETFWRQLLRWLVNAAPDRVMASVPRDRVGPRESVEVTAEVVDSTYLSVNNSHVVATVTSPAGQETRVPMEWTVERDGEYKVSFQPEERGLYDVRVEVETEGDSSEVASTHVLVADPVEEYFDAEMQASLLERLAEETGGGFYTPETVGSLPEDVRYTESGSTVYDELDLWDMPIVFLSLMTLAAAEWSFRRVRGLA